jgi:hypothetical protein
MLPVRDPKYPFSSNAKYLYFHFPYVFVPCTLTILNFVLVINELHVTSNVAKLIKLSRFEN